MKYCTINTVKIVMTSFLLNYGLINPTYGFENDNALKDNPINNK